MTAALLIAATLQIKSIRNQTTLNYGYDENAVYAARMALMEGAYPTQDARTRVFQTRRSALCGPIRSLSSRRTDQSLSDDIFRRPANMRSTDKII